MSYQPPPPGPPGYAPPPGPPPVAPGVPVYELSGWWRRVGATLIDGLLIGVAASILSAIFGGFNDSDLAASGDGASFYFDYNGIGILINIVVYIALVPLIMSRTDGRTVGKMATGIRVVREDGEPVDFGFALIREIAIKYFLFGVLAIFTLYIATFANYLWPLWDDQHRALHDKLAKSRVVRVGVVPVAAAWAPGQPAPMAAPAYPPPGYGQPYAPPAPPPDPFAQPQQPPAPPAIPPQTPFPTAPPPPPPAPPYAPPAPPVAPQPVPPQQPPAPPFAPPQPAPQAPPPPPPPAMPPAPPTPATPPRPPVPPAPPQPPAQQPPAPPMAPQPPANAPVPPQPPANAPIPPTQPPPAPPAPPPAQPGQYQPPPGFENPVPED
ncbi:MAG: RDD family protein [Actinobacteria bacterium]|nr:RDD family protein [Actinomycetota bacterium]